MQPFLRLATGRTTVANQPQHHFVHLQLDTHGGVHRFSLPQKSVSRQFRAENGQFDGPYGGPIEWAGDGVGAAQLCVPRLRQP